MPLSDLNRAVSAPTQRLSPKVAGMVTVAIGGIVLALDYVTPADFVVAVLYGVAIVTAAWTGSKRFVWTTAGIFVALLLLRAALAPSAELDWGDVWANRSLTAVGLLIITRVLTSWMNNVSMIESQRTVTRQLVDTLDLAQVIIRQLDGTILFWSQGAERLYGWTAQEAAGKLSQELLSTDYGDLTLNEIKKSLESRSEWIGEVRHRKKGGQTIWVASHWRVHDSALFPHPVITEVNNDVTALKQGESRYRNLTELMPNLVWEVAADGLVTYANQRWREFFGWDPDGIRVEDGTRFIHPDDLEKWESTWREAGRTRLVEPWEARFRRHDGAYRWFAFKAVAVTDDAGHVVHWIATATDIQDERNVAERLRESQKLESVGRLAGGVAHDFNNLLTVISGYNSMLRDRVAGVPGAAGYCDEIGGAADRAAALTAQLLSFSKPQHSRPKPINLNKTVENISLILGRVIGEDVRLVTHLEKDLPNIYVDPVHIDQVIMNLAVNARDAMPDGGTLEIETGTLVLGDVDARAHKVSRGAYVVLAVNDTGMGMSEETKNRLFEPFFTTKERGKGTGLGLSIVYGVVKHSGGFVAVESAPGKGSEFRVVLPVCLAQEQEEERVTPAISPQSSKGETLLIVEDEHAVRSLVADALRRHGYLVLEAATPSAALEIAKDPAHPIALVVSDVLMPEMRGPQMVELLRAYRPDVPVLYMSGYADSTFITPGILEGANYIQKPFQPSKLAEVVAKILAETPRQNNA